MSSSQKKEKIVINRVDDDPQRRQLRISCGTEEGAKKLLETTNKVPSRHYTAWLPSPTSCTITITIEKGATQRDVFTKDNCQVTAAECLSSWGFSEEDFSVDRPAATEDKLYKIFLTCPITSLQKFGGATRGRFSGFDFAGRYQSFNPIIDPSELLKSSEITSEVDRDEQALLNGTIS